MFRSVELVRILYTEHVSGAWAERAENRVERSGAWSRRERKRWSGSGARNGNGAGSGL